jgi:hypothetical protein
MEQHSLQGRTESEVTWFQRRGFITAAAAWTTMGGFNAAQAQQRSNIVELVGDALINGERLRAEQAIQTGDELQTGPGANLVFVLGNASFLVRQNSRFTVERGTTLSVVSALRLLTGAVASVCGARAIAGASSHPHSPQAFAAPGCTPRCCLRKTFAAIFAIAMVK